MILVFSRWNNLWYFLSLLPSFFLLTSSFRSFFFFFILQNFSASKLMSKRGNEKYIASDPIILRIANEDGSFTTTWSFIRNVWIVLLFPALSSRGLLENLPSMRENVNCFWVRASPTLTFVKDWKINGLHL